MVNIVQCFGDSHARYFEINPKLLHHAPWLKGVDVEVNKIPASSIIGLGRKRSSLGAGEKIRSSLLDGSFLVLAFGQVDIELGYYFRKVVKKEGVTPNSFIDSLVDAYESFIKSLEHNGRVCIKGLNLTVLKYDKFAYAYVKRVITENIDDKTEIEECSRLLEEEIGSFRFRNNLSLECNNRLKLMCDRNGWGYFDINGYLSGFNLGKGLKDDFIPAGFDHHLIDSIDIRKAHLSKLMELYRGP